MPERGSILCLTTYLKGQAFMRECSRLGCEVTLLTENKLASADWPFDSLAAFHTMPAGMTTRQIINTVTYLSRSRRFDSIVALDEFDMETAAALREHFRMPGMSTSETCLFRDKLAMRVAAQAAGVRVPAFTGVFNYDRLRDFTARVPAPWVLKPRTQAASLGIRKLRDPESLWRTLDELGDEQSFFVLEQFLPGKVFHVDGIVSNGKVELAAAHGYSQPPMQLTNEGGIFSTLLLERDSEISQRLIAAHASVIKALGMRYGVTHTEYIKADSDGEIYFLEAAARVGGAFIAEVVEASYGVNPWVEWARLEVAAMRNEKYRLPELRNDYGGSVLCLAQQEWPDTSAYNDPEIVHRIFKRHHAGLIVRAKDPARTRKLLEDYGRRFLADFCAVLPPPERPTA